MTAAVPMSYLVSRNRRHMRVSKLRVGVTLNAAARRGWFAGLLGREVSTPPRAESTARWHLTTDVLLGLTQ